MTLKKPSMFSASGLPHALFGDTFVVVSVWQPTGSTWSAEYHILIKRPNEFLISGVVNFDTLDYPPELDPVDEQYMVAEALRQAEIDLITELERRATDANRPELAYLPLNLIETKITPVSLWVRDVFPTKFGEMAKTAKSQFLTNYLRTVMGLQKMRGGKAA